MIQREVYRFEIKTFLMSTCQTHNCMDEWPVFIAEARIPNVPCTAQERVLMRIRLIFFCVCVLVCCCCCCC